MYDVTVCIQLSVNKKRQFQFLVNRKSEVAQFLLLAVHFIQVAQNNFQYFAALLLQRINATSRFCHAAMVVPNKCPAIGYM